LGTAGGYGDQLDGAESELKVDGEHCNKKDNRHWQSEQGDEAAEEHRKATGDLDADCDPCHEVRCRNGEAMEGCGEGLWAANEFGESMLKEAEAHDEPQGQRCKARECVSKPRCRMLQIQATR